MVDIASVDSSRRDETSAPGAEPAWYGFVETTRDALLVFEGCRRTNLHQVTRRLTESEKRKLIISGNVFVFDEEQTGIKRWTDGLTWSPSRTLGNFLVYREINEKNANGNKSNGGGKAKGKGKGKGGGSDGDVASVCVGGDDLFGGMGGTGPEDVDPFGETPLPLADMSSTFDLNSDFMASATTNAVAGPSSTPAGGPRLPMDRNRERALVGSLVSSYRFKPGGLVKKTISLNGLHMIGYYKIDDVHCGRLRQPSSLPEYDALEISSAFLAPSLFRNPPVTEIGPNGQLRYKGEPEAPLSPLTRSGSSQGFGTPALGGPRSRPPSSDSASGCASPRLPILTSSISHREPNAPGSPHRSQNPLRASNRFDPYSMGSRTSPSMATYAQTSTSSFPFPSPSTHSPTGMAFPNLTLGSSEELYAGNIHGGATSPQTSSMTTMVSSSAPVHQQIWGSNGVTVGSHGGMHHQQLPVQRSRTVASDQLEYYQPRQAAPFDPAETSNPFAYEAPPPRAVSSLSTRDARSSTSSSAYNSYQRTSIPASALQQQQQHDQRPSSSHQQQMPYTPHPPVSSALPPTHLDPAYSFPGSEGSASPYLGDPSGTSASPYPVDRPRSSASYAVRAAPPAPLQLQSVPPYQDHRSYTDDRQVSRGYERPASSHHPQKFMPAAQPPMHQQSVIPPPSPLSPHSHQHQTYYQPVTPTYPSYPPAEAPSPHSSQQYHSHQGYHQQHQSVAYHEQPHPPQQQQQQQQHHHQRPQVPSGLVASVGNSEPQQLRPPSQHQHHHQLQHQHLPSAQIGLGFGTEHLNQLGGDDGSSLHRNIKAEAASNSLYWSQNPQHVASGRSSWQYQEVGKGFDPAMTG